MWKEGAAWRAARGTAPPALAWGPAAPSCGGSMQLVAVAETAKAAPAAAAAAAHPRYTLVVDATGDGSSSGGGGGSSSSGGSSSGRGTAGLCVTGIGRTAAAVAAAIHGAGGLAAAPRSAVTTRAGAAAASAAAPALRPTGSSAPAAVAAPAAAAAGGGGGGPFAGLLSSMLGSVGSSQLASALMMGRPGAASAAAAPAAAAPAAAAPRSGPAAAGGRQGEGYPADFLSSWRPTAAGATVQDNASAGACSTCFLGLCQVPTPHSHIYTAPHAPLSRRPLPQPIPTNPKQSRQPHVPGRRPPCLQHRPDPRPQRPAPQGAAGHAAAAAGRGRGRQRRQRPCRRQ
jgi:hypothetical protein